VTTSALAANGTARNQSDVSALRTCRLHGFATRPHADDDLDDDLADDDPATDDGLGSRAPRCTGTTRDERQAAIGSTTALRSILETTRATMSR
jgi:hypothetical protein